jgi:LacI family transcriptional regulator
MRELKIPIPSKMEIISMGGTMMGAITVPSLTTIDFNPHKHGYEAARLLLDVLEKKRIQPFHLILPGTLVERDSTK